MRDVNNMDRSFVHQLKNDMSWDDIKWMRANTKLKIILKGVISPKDILLADQLGVDAIWISNHGGRQLDTCPATVLSIAPIRQKLRCKLIFIQK